MTAPGARVKVLPTIQERPDRLMPWVVRWKLDGKLHGKPFQARGAADRFRARLLVAVEDEAKWSAVTGEPVSWSVFGSVDVATFCRLYLRGEWSTLAPNSRRSLAGALAVMVERAAKPGAPAWPSTRRGEVVAWLADADRELSPATASWVARYSLHLDALDGPALVELDKRMRCRIDGTPLAKTTSQRQVVVARRCLDEAVAMGAMASNEWPKKDRGRASRKSSKVAKVPIVVPSEDVVRAVLAEMPSHQPASLMYQAMSWTSGWAALRPQEVVALERADVDLPESGWGTARVRSAWNGCGEMWGTPSENLGPVKTFYREVPLHPELVAVLRDWSELTGIVSGPLFRTRNGERPTQSNWGRSMKRACARVGVEQPSYPYALRHFRGSHWVASGLELPRVAELMGHSLETLVKVYAHPVERSRAEVERLLGA